MIFILWNYKRIKAIVSANMKENTEITEILYRANGIININYKIVYEGSNVYSMGFVTLRYRDGIVSLEEKPQYYIERDAFYFGGDYKSAMFPNEQTVYPEKFPVI